MKLRWTPAGEMQDGFDDNGGVGECGGSKHVPLR